MAKEYYPPIDPPEITTEQLISGEWIEIEDKYIKELADLAKANGNSDLLGGVIRFPRGDGYARYMVWNTKPLSLIWLPLGDRWEVEEALIRGLLVKDIKNMLKREKALSELFS